MRIQRFSELCLVKVRVRCDGFMLGAGKGIRSINSPDKAGDGRMCVY